MVGTREQLVAHMVGDGTWAKVYLTPAEVGNGIPFGVTYVDDLGGGRVEFKGFTDRDAALQFARGVVDPWGQTNPNGKGNQ